ncbi:hypothetical protein VST63_25945 [Mycolicibacterium sp. 050232]|uniref:hypothetical protein n=1 Tax=Mycolicibacterium sp. 050232 TaxID=3113982 RepID=UPI002E2993B2|nr:hypothetical protein [Mycolicibacterium sp. 050232]MED5815816.1 hypothetical protein [Mycolicibacterium sp. 050232]
MTAVPTGAPVGSAASVSVALVAVALVAVALVVIATGVPVVVVHPAAAAAATTTLTLAQIWLLRPRIPETTTTDCHRGRENAMLTSADVIY